MEKKHLKKRLARQAKSSASETESATQPSENSSVSKHIESTSDLDDRSVHQSECSDLSHAMGGNESDEEKEPNTLVENTRPVAVYFVSGKNPMIHLQSE